MGGTSLWLKPQMAWPSAQHGTAGFKGYRPCRRPLFSIQRASMVRTMGLCDVMLRMAWRQSGHDEADK